MPIQPASANPAALLALSGLAGLLAWATHHGTGGHTTRRSARSPGLGTRVVGWHAVLFTAAGLIALFGTSGGLLAGLHVAAWPLAARAAAVRAATRVPDSPASLGPAFAVRTLTDHQLCLAWCTSYAAIQRASGAPERARLALLRATYLDELERRAPTGFAPWLTGGARAGGNPRPLLSTVRQPPGSAPI